MNEQASQLLQTGKNEKHFSCQLRKGCKPIYGLYPDMVNCVTNILKQNSLATDDEEMQIKQQELELH